MQQPAFCHVRVGYFWSSCLFLKRSTDLESKRETSSNTESNKSFLPGQGRTVVFLHSMRTRSWHGNCQVTSKHQSSHLCTAVQGHNNVYRSAKNWKKKRKKKTAAADISLTVEELM